jgi:hypothetical protein
MAEIVPLLDSHRSEDEDLAGAKTACIIPLFHPPFPQIAFLYIQFLHFSCLVRFDLQISSMRFLRAKSYVAGAAPNEKPTGPDLERSDSDKTLSGPAQAPPTNPKAVEDPNLVTWDGDNDPKNPKNWSMGSKWAVCYYTDMP